MRALCSRADLLWTLHATDPGCTDVAARMLGFAVASSEGKPLLAAPAIEVADPLAGAEVAAPLRPVPFFRVELVEERGTPSVEAPRGAPLPATAILGPAPAQKPKKGPLLVSWANLWPTLHRALAATRSTRELDVPRLIHQLSRGRVLRAMPTRTRYLWPDKLTIYLDRSPRLIPLFGDQERVRQALKCLIGRRHLEVRVCAENPGRAAPVDPHRRGHPVAAGAAVLALSDLGAYGSALDRARWLQLARQLRHGGHPLAALVPGMLRQAPAVFTAWNAEPWERVRPELDRLGEVPHRQQVTERLLCLLSFAVRVEPGLLREVRRLLPERTTAVAELDVWSHADVDGAHIDAFRQGEDSARERRAELKRYEPKPLVALVADRVREWHRAVLRPEVWYEEVVELSQIAPDTVTDRETQQARVFLESLAPTLDGADVSPAARRAVADWIRRLTGRLSSTAWHDPQWREALGHAWQRVHARDPETPAPPGADPARLASLAPTRRYDIRQWGERFWLVPALRDPVRGVLIASFYAAATRVVVRWPERTQGRDYDLTGQPGLPLQPFELTTDRTRVRVGRLYRPDWAAALGRKHGYLWAKPHGEQGDSKRWWWPLRVLPALAQTQGGHWSSAAHDYYSSPFESTNTTGLASDVGDDRHMPLGKSNPSSSRSASRTDTKSLPSRTKQRGAWSAHPFDRGAAPTWAVEWGEDEWGVWAAFAVAEGISQRMRWIPAGRFLMGSPPQEPGRYDDEGPQHEVTVEGFFMADTECSQALWTAIMGHNPSQFRSAERPVECVSWNDCQRFLSKLKQRLPDLEPVLPSEAQWEYACRVGGYRSGNRVDEVELAQSTTLDEVAWYVDNSHLGFELNPPRRAGTHSIAGKQPNRWGLYDMLGNVWEWCADVYRPYGVPVAVGEGRGELPAERVLRGGSWGDGARTLRPAKRFCWSPVARGVHIGLRLAAREP